MFNEDTFFICAWQHLDTIGHRTISFDELPDQFQAYIDGAIIGRIVVEIN